MTNITLLNRHGSPVEMVMPALFNLQSNEKYGFKKSAPMEKGWEIKKNCLISISLFRTPDDGYACYTACQEDGISLLEEDSLHQMYLPLTLYKNPDFIQFLKDTGHEKTEHHYLIVEGDAPTSCVDRINGIHFISNGKLLEKLDCRISDTVYCAVVIGFNNKQALVTNIGTPSPLKYRTLWAEQSAQHPDGYQRPKEWDSILNKLKTDQSPPSSYTIDLSINHHDYRNIDPTNIHCLNKAGSPLIIAIHGQIFAEYLYDLPEPDSQDFKQIKTVCYKNNSGIGVGFVAFGVHAQTGALSYLNRMELKTLDGTLFKDNPDIGSKAIVDAVKRLLQQQGVVAPERYVGILTAETLLEPCYTESYGLHLYGDCKFILPCNVGQMMVMQQNGQSMIYCDVFSQQRIEAVTTERLAAALNSMSLSNHPERMQLAQDVIHHLKQHPQVI